jgi:pyruvate dehydrogenase E2 component (dihydrolipoyllysine-residue acetyltransferase)
MSIPVVMPQLGLTMEEGTVTMWLKKTGDSVKKDDPLLTLTTDKAEVEVECPADGTLGQILIQAGDAVPVGTILAYIEGGAEVGAAIDGERPLPKVLQHVPPTAEAPGPQRAQPALPQALSRATASPRAKRLARGLGLKLEDIIGGGHVGPIRETDVRNAATCLPVPGKTGTGYRQIIAERLTRSVQTIPTFSVSAEANAEKLLDFHQSMKPSPLKVAAAKLTITDLLLKLLALALKESPELNAVWLDNSVHNMTSVDIGLAVDTPKGVAAPVVRKADTLDLPTLAAERSRLAENARRGRLSLAELEGGAATLSNLGRYRVDRFQGIISPGQSSILAVGQIRERPWVDVILGIKPTVILNLTVDHRIADGAAGAGFLGKIIDMIESSDPVLWTAHSTNDDDEPGGAHAEAR